MSTSVVNCSSTTTTPKCASNDKCYTAKPLGTLKCFTSMKNVPTCVYVSNAYIQQTRPVCRTRSKIISFCFLTQLRKSLDQFTQRNNIVHETAICRNPHTLNWYFLITRQFGYKYTFCQNVSTKNWLSLHFRKKTYHAKGWSIEKRCSFVSCKTVYRWVTINCLFKSDEISFLRAVLNYNINLTIRSYITLNTQRHVG